MIDPVPVLQGSIENIGDDLHVLVRVGGESPARGYLVVVDHGQGSEVHVLGIEVPSEGETVIAVEPTQIGVAAAGRLPDEEIGVLLAEDLSLGLAGQMNESACGEGDEVSSSIHG